MRTKNSIDILKTCNTTTLSSYSTIKLSVFDRTKHYPDTLSVMSVISFHKLLDKCSSNKFKFQPKGIPSTNRKVCLLESEWIGQLEKNQSIYGKKLWKVKSSAISKNKENNNRETVQCSYKSITNYFIGLW